MFPFVVYDDSTKKKNMGWFDWNTVVLTLNPVAPENGIIFSLPQAVPAGQIKSFAIPQQKETIN
jgi:hypothetical protein